MIFNSKKWIERTGILIGEIWLITVLSQMFAMFRSSCNVTDNNHFNPFSNAKLYTVVFKFRSFQK